LYGSALGYEDEIMTPIFFVGQRSSRIWTQIAPIVMARFVFDWNSISSVFIWGESFLLLMLSITREPLSIIICAISVCKWTFSRGWNRNRVFLYHAKIRPFDQFEEFEECPTAPRFPWAHLVDFTKLSSARVCHCSYHPTVEVA
jgi:hypothetical protein